MTERRIIFLDIDGVLNSTGWLLAIARGETSRPELMVDGKARRPPFDPAAVALLNRLVRPGVEWVLSSTWRGDGSRKSLQHVERMLRQLGWEGVFIAATPVIRNASTSIHADHSRGLNATRGDEIAAWLEAECVPRSSWLCILDDDSDVSPLEGSLVHVDERVGLTAEDVDQALVKLGLGLADGDGDAISRVFGGF